MKSLLRLEGLALMLLGIIGFHYIDYSWWWFAGLFLAPDIGMLGYLISTRIGAITYNIFHHLLIAIVVLTAGYFLHLEWLVAGGFILLSHIGFDRMLGYGLKYSNAFKNTHLDKF